MLQKKEPSAELKALLDRHELIGGVVNYTLFSFTQEYAHPQELHHAAALSFMEDLKQIELEHQKLVREKHPEYAGMQFFELTFEPAKMKGVQINLAAFLGAYFDPKQARLIVRGRTEPFRHLFFYAGDAETKENILDHELVRDFDDSNLPHAYAHAFYTPPYGLAALPMEVNDLFNGINRLLFNSAEYTTLAEHLEIYSWSTDWSNYFDAGLEWWGAYLWTIRQKDENILVAIAASTTD